MTLFDCYFSIVIRSKAFIFISFSIRFYFFFRLRPAELYPLLLLLMRYPTPVFLSNTIIGHKHQKLIQTRRHTLHQSIPHLWCSRDPRPFRQKGILHYRSSRMPHIYSSWRTPVVRRGSLPRPYSCVLLRTDNTSSFRNFSFTLYLCSKIYLLLLIMDQLFLLHEVIFATVQQSSFVLVLVFSPKFNPKELITFH